MLTHTGPFTGRSFVVAACWTEMEVLIASFQYLARICFVAAVRWAMFWKSMFGLDFAGGLIMQMGYERALAGVLCELLQFRLVIG